MVIDLNVVWKPQGQLPIDDRTRLIVPHAIVGDILKSGERLEHQSRFESFFRRYHQQMYVAMDWGQIIDLEEKRGSPLVEHQWCDFTISKILQNWNPQERIDWNLFAQSDLVRSYEDNRKEFLSGCEYAAEFLLKTFPEEIKKCKQIGKIDLELVRKPLVGCLLARRRFKGAALEDMEKQLAIFPDHYGMGRATRIWFYYGCQLALGRTKEWQKNFDDANYAHAASYAGKLLTGDERLAELLEAVFTGRSAFNAVSGQKLFLWTR